jgi:hypothetical protein
MMPAKISLKNNKLRILWLCHKKGLLCSDGVVHGVCICFVTPPPVSPVTAGYRFVLAGLYSEYIVVFGGVVTKPHQAAADVIYYY